MYTIYRNFYKCPYNAIKPLLKKAMDKKSKTRRKVVFDARRRRSATSASCSTKHRFVRFLKNKLERKGLMEGLEMKECHLLHSEKGCLRQKLHYDFNPDTIPNLAVKPRSVLLALEDETKLIVWDKDTAKPKELMLKRGDCVVFNADVVHAGAAYDKPNTRLFCYLDAEDAPRKPNQVWFPDLTRLKLASRPKRQCKKRDIFTIGFEPASDYKTWSYLKKSCVIDGFKIEELCSK